MHVCLAWYNPVGLGWRFRLISLLHCVQTADEQSTQQFLISMATALKINRSWIHWDIQMSRNTVLYQKWCWTGMSFTSPIFYIQTVHISCIANHTHSSLYTLKLSPFINSHTLHPLGHTEHVTDSHTLFPLDLQYTEHLTDSHTLFPLDPQHTEHLTDSHTLFPLDPQHTEHLIYSHTVPL